MDVEEDTGGCIYFYEKLLVSILIIFQKSLKISNPPPPLHRKRNFMHPLEEAEAAPEQDANDSILRRVQRNVPRLSRKRLSGLSLSPNTSRVSIGRLIEEDGGGVEQAFLMNYAISTF